MYSIYIPPEAEHREERFSELEQLLHNTERARLIRVSSYVPLAVADVYDPQLLIELFVEDGYDVRLAQEMTTTQT